MKIIKKNQNLMIIKERNVFVFLLGAIFTIFGFLVIFKPDFFNVNKPPLWSGFFGILSGLFIIFIAKITTIILDKNTRKLVFKWKTLIKEQSKEYNLDQIKQLELQQVYTSTNKGKIGYSYKLVFILSNNEEVPLNQYGSSISQAMRKKTNVEKLIGTKIANFLNVPFQEKRLPTVTEILSTIQETMRKEIEKREIEKNKKSNF